MSRARKILFAGYLALGFLALRFLYAFVFSGLDGEQVLFALPELRLQGPFSHITLFGSVSVEGILRNLELALPFALSIIVFGVLASFVSPQLLSIAASKFPPLGNLFSAIAIGLSTIPGLFEAARKVFAARKLRGEKVSRMLVPILERAVELAGSLGLKLATEPQGTQRARGISVREIVVEDIGLGPINLEVSPGELIILSGPTGCGKSTLLEAIAGILGEYRGREVTGSIQFDGKTNMGISEIANFLAYIPQNPREMLWGFDAENVLRAIPKEISRLDLETFKTKDISALSEGEVLKLLVAQSLAHNPSILLLDEPYAPLDASSRIELTALLNELAESGITILVVEHEPEHTQGLNARHLQLLASELKDGQHIPERPNISRSLPLVGSDVALRAELADVAFTEVLIHSPRVELRQGECVWLSGDNGSGKTSFLKALSKAQGVLVHGQKPQNPRALALVPENFDDFFVTDTLQAELLRSDRIAGVARGFTKTTLESILPGLEINTWLDVHPRDLSRGTRLALAISMQLSHKPQALLVDEPFRGLDLKARELMVESLKCVGETGCAILFASHEASWSKALASRSLQIKDKKLVELVEVSA